MFKQDDAWKANERSFHRGTALLTQLEEVVLGVSREGRLNVETIGPTEICRCAGWNAAATRATSRSGTTSTP